MGNPLMVHKYDPHRDYEDSRLAKAKSMSTKRQCPELRREDRATATKHQCLDLWEREVHAQSDRVVIVPSRTPQSDVFAAVERLNCLQIKIIKKMS